MKSFPRHFNETGGNKIIIHIIFTRHYFLRLRKKYYSSLYPFIKIIKIFSIIKIYKIRKIKKTKKKNILVYLGTLGDRFNLTELKKINNRLKNKNLYLDVYGKQKKSYLKLSNIRFLGELNNKNKIQIL